MRPLRKLLAWWREHWACMVVARMQLVRSRADAVRASRGQKMLGPIRYEELVRIGLVTPRRSVPAGCVEAHVFVRKSIGSTLKAAREHAGLSVEELSWKLLCKPSRIEEVEQGSGCSERYVLLVLRACGLPDDWAAPKPKGD